MISQCLIIYNSIWGVGGFLDANDEMENSIRVCVFRHPATHNARHRILQSPIHYM